MLEKIAESGHSRFPVYSESIDNVIGVLYVKDLIAAFARHETIDLEKHGRKAFFVPESKRIDSLLREFQEISGNQSRRTQSSVARRNRGGDNAEQRKDTANGAEMCFCDSVDNHGGIVLVHTVFAEEARGCSRPDKRNNAFGYHCAIECRTCVIFAFKTFRHHRTLRCVEAGNSATSNADKHYREYGERFRIWVCIAYSVPYFGDSGMANE